MKIAVDVCIGRVGVQHLRDIGHEVVVEAEHCETDRSWFSRAVDAGAELIISSDVDLEILAYDHNLKFYRHESGRKGLDVVQSLMTAISRRQL